MAKQAHRFSPIVSLTQKVDVKRELDSEGFLQRIVDACATSVAVLDECGGLLYVSRGWQLFAERNGLTSAKDAYGLNELHTGDSTGADKSTLVADIQRMLRKGQTEFLEEYVFTRSKPPRWFRIRTARLDMPSPAGLRVLISLEDITTRKLAEEELRNIGGRLLKAQEEERTRIARELHDDLSQRLAILSIELAQLCERVPEGDEDLLSLVKSLGAQARALSTDIHRISYSLHPFKLDHLGLTAAVRSLCDELSEVRNISIKFQEKGFPAVLPHDVILCVFRIAQESLHNIIKHSGAAEAKVILTKTSTSVRLRVSDNGCGFDIESAKMKKRLGLISMKERLRLVGGEISIRSSPLKGTQVDALIPLVSEANATTTINPEEVEVLV